MRAISHHIHYLEMMQNFCTINESASIEFKVAPDFENPEDNNSDNVYTS